MVLLLKFIINLSDGAPFKKLLKIEQNSKKEISFGEGFDNLS